MKHTLIALMEDKPGVLNRIAGLFQRRNYNIESLSVGHSETAGISRMTIVLDGEDIATVLAEEGANLQALMDETGAPCWAPDPPSDGPCPVQ